jgi:hypothetical protein
MPLFRSFSVTAIALTTVIFGSTPSASGQDFPHDKPSKVIHCQSAKDCATVSAKLAQLMKEAPPSEDLQALSTTVSTNANANTSNSSDCSIEPKTDLASANPSLRSLAARTILLEKGQPPSSPKLPQLMAQVAKLQHDHPITDAELLSLKAKVDALSLIPPRTK